MSSCHNVPFKLGDYNIYDINGGIFRAVSQHEIILFNAEYGNGCLISNILSYTDKNTNRCYKAPRYVAKYVPKVHIFAQQLLLHDYLWDYKNRVPALITYNKRMLIKQGGE